MTETRLGSRRSRKFEITWTIPWGYTKPVPHIKFARMGIAKIEKMGWTFERALKMWAEPEPSINERGDQVQTWVLEALFSKKVSDLVAVVPDYLVPGLLQHPKLGPLVKNVS